MPPKHRVVRQPQTPNLTKSQRLDAMARKKDERAVRTAHKREKQAQKYVPNDATLSSFDIQLNKLGLQLRNIPGDGNCLFRALGDQLDGHGRTHHKHRRDVVKFMSEHRADFEPFVEDDIPFERHVECLGSPGTYAGNDAIVAFARLHQLTVIIHQLNSPILEVNGTDKPNSKQVHVSYHNGDHYSSVRRLGDESELPSNIRFVNGTILQNEKVTAPNVKPFQKHSLTSQDDWFAHGCYDDHGSVEYDGPLVNKNISEAELDAFVDNVKFVTKCSDKKLIRTLLEDNGYDLEMTVSALIQIMSALTKDNVSMMPLFCGGSIQANSSTVCCCDVVISLHGSTDNSSAHQTSSDSDTPSTPADVSKPTPCLNGECGDETVNGINGFAARNHTSAGHGDNGASGAIPKCKSRQKTVRGKRERKLEKKARAEERHRQKFLAPDSDQLKTTSSDDDDIHTVINETLQVLQI